VRIARDCGDISSLFPPGIERLWDLPYTLHQAVRLALYFLSFEELPIKERPPKRIWLNSEKMDAWWSEVKADREAQAKGQGSYRDMPQNAFIAEIFGGKVPVG
jgi:hypothetical protein